jgi:polyisoprenoid-binding protein YceI
MPRYDATTAECLVFTFKEGLLSAIAHDLKIRVTDFAIDFERDTVEARFDARSLRVVTAMRDGVEAPSLLGDSDKRKIEQTIVSDVLLAAKNPDIRFRASAITRRDDGGEVTGDLTLGGRTRSITLSARKDGEHYVTEVSLHQPDFGLKPYSAMLGALKIKPDLRVRVRVPV